MQELETKNIEDTLRNEFIKKRQELNLSVRQTSQQIGVSFISLMRFERGGFPGKHTQYKISSWIFPENTGMCSCSRCNKPIVVNRKIAVNFCDIF